MRPCYHEDFMRKIIENFLRYALKISKITNFRLPPVKKRSRDSLLGQLEPWKLANRILVTWQKNHMHIICRYSSRKQGGVSTTKIPLTVRSLMSTFCAEKQNMIHNKILEFTYMWNTGVSCRKDLIGVGKIAYHMLMLLFTHWLIVG